MEKATAKLQHFVSDFDEQEVESNALNGFDYRLRFPIPRFRATCRRCNTVASQDVDDDLQLSRFQSKKNQHKQFPYWFDMLFKCCRCSCVEAFGHIPTNKREHLDVIEDYDSYVVEWRDVLEANKASLEREEALAVEDEQS